MKRLAAIAAASMVFAWWVLDEGPAAPASTHPKAQLAAGTGPEQAEAPRQAGQQDALRNPGAAGSGVSNLLGSSALAAPASGASPTSTPALAPNAADLPKHASARQSALASLDTRLVQQRVGPESGGLNAFAAKSWVVEPPPPPTPPPPPPEPAPEPPPPQAPPLPFKYMGMLQETPERAVWYLLQGDRLVVAATGEQIDGTYRIDGAEAGQLRFTFLPLNQRQSLPIGASP